jgi:hypothetical protein
MMSPADRKSIDHLIAWLLKKGDRKWANELKKQMLSENPNPRPSPHQRKQRAAVTAMIALFLALSGMAQTNNVVVRIEPSYHMVGSLTMLDGRVYQAQEATLFTNYENVVMFEGQPHTNLLKSIQGITLTNFADLKFVRTDAPVMPPLPPKLLK